MSLPKKKKPKKLKENRSKGKRKKKEVRGPGQGVRRPRWLPWACRVSSGLPASALSLVGGGRHFSPGPSTTEGDPVDHGALNFVLHPSSDDTSPGPCRSFPVGRGWCGGGPGGQARFPG